MCAGGAACACVLVAAVQIIQKCDGFFLRETHPYFNYALHLDLDLDLCRCTKATCCYLAPYVPVLTTVRS